MASNLLNYCILVEQVGPRLDIPPDIVGRCLLLLKRADGENIQWCDLSSKERLFSRPDCLLIQPIFARHNSTSVSRMRLLQQKLKFLPIPFTSTRKFCVAFFTSKLKATIGDIGNMIGWESDNDTLGRVVVAAKQSFLRLILHIMPPDSNKSFPHHLVLDHHAFGIHNMSTAGDELVTALYEWETAPILPAILSDPLMAVGIDQGTDPNAAPSLSLVPDYTTPDSRAEYMTWARQYFKELFGKAPNYKCAIKGEKDARHLWFALRDGQVQDPEKYFGDLGACVERRMEVLCVDW